MNSSVKAKSNHQGISVTPTTPESFSYETKYIVLNFMSMIPERYTSHPHTPLSSTSESDPFIKQHSKSRSLPSSPPKYKKQASKKYSYSDRLPPQASEDNVGYRYRKETRKYLKQNTCNGNDSNGVLDSFLNTSHDLNDKTVENIESDNKPHGRDSFNLTQFRQMTMANRTDSEMSNWTAGSDCTDYTSDADDELEETSNASSVFGSWPGLKHRGFKGDGMDFLQVGPRLPTVLSESEFENYSVSSHLTSPGFDTVDGKNMSVKSPVDISDVEIDVTELDNVGSPETDLAESASVSIDIGDSCNSTTTGSLDHSKLRLCIQDQNEWEAEENRKLGLIMAEMRAELQDELTSFESEVEDAIKKRIIQPIESPFSTPVSPQTEAARILARIGDEVKDHYEQKLQEAMGRLFPEQRPEYLNYDNFRRIANDVIDHSLPGWRQVALILLYGQNAAWRAVENGWRGIGNFVDYTTRLIADSTAEFIIQEGGWGAVMNFDPSQSSESPISPDSLRDIPSILEDAPYHVKENDGSETENSPVTCRNHSMSNNNQPSMNDYSLEHESPFTVDLEEFIDAYSLEHESPVTVDLEEFIDVSSDNEEEKKKEMWYRSLEPWDLFHIAVCFLHYVGIGIYSSLKSPPK